jgi:hypothetical protein
VGFALPIALAMPTACGALSHGEVFERRGLSVWFITAKQIEGTNVMDIKSIGLSDFA